MIGSPVWFLSLAKYDAEMQVRAAAFTFLASVSARHGGLVRQEDVAEFRYRDERIPLMDRQRGIRKPKQLSAALSIRTVHAANPQARPYDDDVGQDGFLRYKWGGVDPNQALGLR